MLILYCHLWKVRRLTLSFRFHGAYCTILEAEPLYDVFGQLDVVAPTLPEMADKIIAATQ